MDGIIHFFGKKTSQGAVHEGLAPLFPRLWRYALVLTRNRDSANDLAQMACLRAIEKADQFQVGTHLDRWVFRIAQRIWLNELRSQAVRRGAGLLPVEDLDLADEKPGPETNYFASEVLKEVGNLPEAQRMAVILVYAEGFTYAEAAEILDIPAGTVMSRLSAARKRLNAQLGDQGTEKG